VPRSPRLHVEPARKRLFHPLHNLQQLEPVGGLDVKREPLVPDDKPTHLEGKFPLRLDKHPTQKHDRLQQLEYRLPVVDRRPNMVPNMFR
jgi:hypothetical protein